MKWQSEANNTEYIHIYICEKNLPLLSLQKHECRCLHGLTEHSQWIHTATHAHFCGLYCSPGVTGTILRLNPPLRCPLFGRWKSTEDSNKCDEASHFLWSHFLGDSIKTMASMGKWINATYTRLLRCWYICDDSKYLKAEHLILRFFNLYRLWCTGWFRVWLRMLELKQLST